ncbi:hypothetical protein EMIHUDRAFT_453141 [Emiliania huxleyi CCMP1516]|uniref:ATP-dependent RNA helicase n=2 Tax=Emiliania huxleyi TaxID=2903 RepID=A0A0D3IAY3_EMIH1|nr:hypothetical protein EMIHUDRAFT_453141 [Emiliania huxleyi CCMP1516]EOD08418.1 hypothetical protein EMIHUDRAFT_453141 [Emiliania huxleyi CCMP1516]|eukprot:XP_005760847.1 hypothetical protein EMIHUDRAFT_453141 [Emiliania huxleyi CCMP1516]
MIPGRQFCSAAVLRAARASPASPCRGSSFAALGVPSVLASRLAALGMRRPTPVQDAAMSLLMKRPGASPLAEPPKSAVLRWHTGSGKTLAYLLPLLARVDPRERAVQCVIVVPSRELCLQTLRLLKAVSGHGRANKKGNALRVSSAMGRVNTRMESELRCQPPHVLVGTPQPLGVLLHSRVLPLASNAAARVLVLDEAPLLSSDGPLPPSLRHVLLPPGGAAAVVFVESGAGAERVAFVIKSLLHLWSYTE